MRVFGFEISGHLDVFVAENEEEFDGEVQRWKDVLIHGDPEGLRSFANLLLKLADIDQESIPEKELPIGAREHRHLRPDLELSGSSVEVIVGRLDAKGTGEFYERYVAKESIS